MKLKGKHKQVLDLLRYFIKDKNDFIVHSLDLYLLYNDVLLFNSKNLQFLFQYEKPTLVIFFSEKNILYKIDKDLFGIPLFPPLKSIFNKLYLKILDLYGGKIDLVVLEDKKYLNLKKNTFEKEGFIFSNIENIKNILYENIFYKLDKKISILGFADVYNLIFKLFILNKLSNKNIFVLDFFKKIDKKFGRNFKFIGGNKGLKKEYIGVARFLNKDYFNIQNEYINEFYKGDIILAKNTDVSYMKYLLKCGGIITINDNKLSHGAIISRELELPLILGADMLFVKIFNGDKIGINSATGEVVILKRFWE